MREHRYPTHDEVRGLLDKLDEICREAERICTEVELGLRRPASPTASFTERPPASTPPKAGPRR